MSLFKNIIILLTLISFFSCAPTTIEKKKPIEKAPEKVEEIEIVEEKEREIEKVETIKKPSKPGDKIIDFNTIDKIIFFLLKISDKDIDFIIKPTVRFKGEIGEQRTMFFRDPSGNAIEIKAFKNIENLFSS